MLCLDEQAGAQSTPGEQALAFGQVVEMLSYWERGVAVGFLESLLGWLWREGRRGEEVGPLWQKHSHWLVSQLSAQICL